MINGVDYASVDENKPPHIEGSGVSFAIVRGCYTYKGVAMKDPHLARDRDSWHAHNVPFGSYMILGFDKAGDTPEDQVQQFVNAYGDRRPGELPPTLDVEFPGGRPSTGFDSLGALDWIHRAYDALSQRYGVVMTYTSARVWHEDLADLDSHLGDGPLWLKVPYAFRAGNPPHPETCPTVITELPKPWQGFDGPRCWIVQYQGDAKPVTGFSSTVDLNAWAARLNANKWVRQQLVRKGYGDVIGFQKAKGLVADGVTGPRTFAVLTA